MRGVAAAVTALTLAPAPALADAGCGACFGCVSCGWLVIGWFVIVVALLVWVARDAKARGDNPVLWLLLVFLVGPIGLVVYLLARTHGDLVPCPNCHNRRLATSTRCPHCGAS